MNDQVPELCPPGVGCPETGARRVGSVALRAAGPVASMESQPRCTRRSLTLLRTAIKKCALHPFHSQRRWLKLRILVPNTICISHLSTYPSRELGHHLPVCVSLATIPLPALTRQASVRQANLSGKGSIQIEFQHGLAGLLNSHLPRNLANSPGQSTIERCPASGRISSREPGMS